MLDNIKKTIFQKYKKTDNKWIFISVFNNDELLMSNWVVESDKELEQNLNTIYHWLVEKHQNVTNIIIDIVTEKQKINDITEIKNISLQEFWLILIWENKSGVLLPNTKWINNISSALKSIKQKNWLWWNVTIMTFKTDRFVF